MPNRPNSVSSRGKTSASLKILKRPKNHNIATTKRRINSHGDSEYQFQVSVKFSLVIFRRELSQIPVINNVVKCVLLQYCWKYDSCEMVYVTTNRQ